MARTISTSLVPIPNARAPNAPWVAVWLSPQTIVMPGLGQAKLGPDDVDDALVRAADPMERDAELVAVRRQLLDLGGGHLVEDRQVARVGRDRVVGRRDRLARVADGQAALARPVNAWGS